MIDKLVWEGNHLPCPTLIHWFTCLVFGTRKKPFVNLSFQLWPFFTPCSPKAPPSVHCPVFWHWVDTWKSKSEEHHGGERWETMQKSETTCTLNSGALWTKREKDAKFVKPLAPQLRSIVDLVAILNCFYHNANQCKACQGERSVWGGWKTAITNQQSSINPISSGFTSQVIPLMFPISVLKMVEGL